jgi:hypothetical protein
LSDERSIAWAAPVSIRPRAALRETTKLRTVMRTPARQGSTSDRKPLHFQYGVVSNPEVPIVASAQRVEGEGGLGPYHPPALMPAYLGHDRHVEDT